MSQTTFSTLRAAALLAAATLPLGCATANPNTITTQSSTALPAIAPGRGVWFWESAAQMAILASPTAQDAALANLKAWNVTSVYGSYSSQIDTNPAAIRAWNARLAASGIRSYLLVSNASFFFPEQWTATQSWIQKYIVDFNAASTTGQAFTGLAFDVEPQSFTGSSTRASWGTATPAIRRLYATYLLNMLLSSRALLNQNGASSLPIETFLAQWWMSLTSTIQWADASDRNAWFAQLAQTVDTVSVDQYGTSSTATILAGLQANNLLLNGKARPALTTGTTDWTSTAAFFQGAAATESQSGIYVDIEDYDTTVN